MDSGSFDRPSSDVNKVISLYKFVKELSALKQTLILNVDKHHWYQPVCKLHNDPNNIELLFRDRVEEERPNVGADLLRVHKPEFQPLPQPNPVLNKWLLDGWKDCWKEARIRESISYTIERKDEEPQTIVEMFSADAARVTAWEKWKPIHDDWAQKQRTIHRTRDLFTQLYQLHIDLERESETLEMER